MEFFTAHMSDEDNQSQVLGIFVTEYEAKKMITEYCDPQYGEVTTSVHPNPEVKIVYYHWNDLEIVLEEIEVEGVEDMVENNYKDDMLEGDGEGY